MNKKEWLEEAVNYIESLDDHEFEAFIMSCVPHYNVRIDYSDVAHGKFIFCSEAANMDIYYTDNISLAA